MKSQEIRELEEEQRRLNDIYHAKVHALKSFSLQFERFGQALGSMGERMAVQDLDRLPLSSVRAAFEERDAAKAALDEITSTIAALRGY
jgi:hypothetical protein